jgi:nitrate/nitrite transporter NarK
VSQTLGPPVGGWLADASGAFRLTFGLAAAAHALGAVAALLLPRQPPLR